MQPAFDARNYGFKKRRELVRNLNDVEVKEVPTVRVDGVTLTNHPGQAQARCRLTFKIAPCDINAWKSI